ncbi:MAG: type II secretion system protein [Phycisphaerales bacterium JB060]
MRNGSTKGFTLIELLIVIAIIGILAAVLIPNLLSARERAFTSANQACANSIVTAQEIYAIDDANSSYASNYATLSAFGEGLNCENSTVSGTTSWAAGNTWTVTHSTGRGDSVRVGPTGLE